MAHQAGSDSLVTLKLYHKSLNDPVLKQQNLSQTAKNIIYKLGGVNGFGEGSASSSQQKKFSFKNFNLKKSEAKAYLKKSSMMMNHHH